MRDVATQHKVTKVPNDSVNYLALAVRVRLQDLITQMIAASHHRTDTQFDRPASLYEDGTPMWSIAVRSDVAKQLAALEKAEREDEMKVRRERKERAELAAQQARDLAGQGVAGASPEGGFDDGEGGGLKKKRKKDGPGVTARNMSEDVRKKMSNAVASQAAGLGGKYAWMNAANAPAATPKWKGGAQSTATSAAAGARLPPLPPLPHRVGPGLTYRRRSRRRGLHSQQRKIIVPSSRSGMQYLWSKRRGGMVEDEEQREVGYDSVSSDCA